MYHVIVLAEQAMSRGDAAEVVSLHESIEEQRQYHVLIPCEDATARIEATLGTLGANEMLTSPPVFDASAELDLEGMQHEIDEHASQGVTASVTALRALGHQADGQFSCTDPIDSLDKLVRETQANEVIVMTRPHLVSEFFHLDWTSKARRRLGVPVLHLVEHEPIDAESGAPEGITGM